MKLWVVMMHFSTRGIWPHGWREKVCTDDFFFGSRPDLSKWKKVSPSLHFHPTPDDSTEHCAHPCASDQFFIKVSICCAVARNIAKLQHKIGIVFLRRTQRADLRNLFLVDYIDLLAHTHGKHLQTAVTRRVGCNYLQYRAGSFHSSLSIRATNFWQVTHFSERGDTTRTNWYWQIVSTNEYARARCVCTLTSKIASSLFRP